MNLLSLSVLESLLSYTTPYGQEKKIYPLLPKECSVDGIGNAFYSNIDESDILFIAHMDNACIKSEKVNIIKENGYWKTNGKTILGADDKAGIYTMLNMIHNDIKGHYLFTVGEEKGGIGASYYVKHNKEQLKNYKKVISFDRRGFSSVITSQAMGICCSDEFSKALASYFPNFSPDYTGTYTDSAEFMDICPECTNLSIGYKSEHTFNEKLNVQWLTELFIPNLLKIDWQSLPVIREPEDIISYYDSFYNDSDFCYSEKIKKLAVDGYCTLCGTYSHYLESYGRYCLCEECMEEMEYY